MISNRTPVFFLVVFLIVVCDRVSKMLVAAAIAPGTGLNVLSFFDIVHYRNTGIAFGILGDLNGIFLTFLYSGAFVAACVFAAVFMRRGGGAALFGSFILGGAIGNSIDRFLFGYVTDFLDFHWFGNESLHWPAFNIADFFITVGAAGIMVDFLNRSGKCSRG